MLLVANQIQLYTSVNDLSKSHGFKFTNVQDSFYPIGIHISICHKRGKIIMPLNNLSFLPGKVTCLSQNKDPLETYDRKLSDVVFCLQEYKRGGGLGCRRTTFLVTANFLTSLFQFQFQQKLLLMLLNTTDSYLLASYHRDAPLDFNTTQAKPSANIFVSQHRELSWR